MSITANKVNVQIGSLKKAVELTRLEAPLQSSIVLETIPANKP